MKVAYERSNGTLLPYGTLIVRLRKYRQDFAYEQDVFFFVCQVLAYTHTGPDVTNIPIEESNTILDQADDTRTFWQDHAHRFPHQTIILNVPLHNIVRSSNTWTYNNVRDPLQSVIYAFIPNPETEPDYEEATLGVCTTVAGWTGICNFMDSYDSRRAILRQLRY